MTSTKGTAAKKVIEAAAINANTVRSRGQVIRLSAHFILHLSAHSIYIIFGKLSVASSVGR